MTVKTALYTILPIGILSVNPAMASDNGITPDFLNSLTAQKVLWSADSGNYQIQTGDKVFYYTYHRPDTYSETNERLFWSSYGDDTAITEVVFKECDDQYSAIMWSPSGKDITVDTVRADFVGNSTIQNSRYHSFGGAIANSTVIRGSSNLSLTIKNITGDFINNYVYSTVTNGGIGGAIGNAPFESLNNVNIDNINGNFIGNYVQNTTSGNSLGGALGNNPVKSSSSVIIGDISGNFIGNYALSASGTAAGGAIMNNAAASGSSVEIKTISGDFIGNHASGKTASGGAIFNSGTNSVIGNILNSSFFDNYAYANLNGGTALGGAIYSTSDINITADDGKSIFSGNYTQSGADGSKVSNAVYIRGTTAVPSTLSLSAVNGGVIAFDDGINGRYYHINISGDVCAACDEARIIFNHEVNNVIDFTLNSTQMGLGHKAVIRTSGNYTALNAPYLRLNLDLSSDSVGRLVIGGNVVGETKLIVNTLNYKSFWEGSAVFATAVNDTERGEDSFVVSRVIGSPYMYSVIYDPNEHTWALVMNGQPNEEPKEPEKPDVPDVPDVPTPELPDIPPVKPQPLPGSDRPVAPEVIGAESLPAAGLAQTSNMIYNIMQKVSSNYSHENEAFHNLWANTVYNTLRIKTPTDIDADVWGLEAGGDLQHDLNNKLGLFLSYRKGNYDMNGDGKHHYSTVGSEIDIDSYLAGLYYRYDRNHWWTFATVYGGIQKVDLKTKDGIKSDTDGTEFGGSVELGYDYNLSKTLYLTPSVGAFYTQVDYDDATDSAGKIAKYNTLRQLELEAGVKLTKAFVTDEGYANVYVKPSVVQTITDGDEVRITGLGKVNTLDDQTLGRVELGGRYGFTEQLSAYGWANHTFGDDYKASTFGLGLSYSW